MAEPFQLVLEPELFRLQAGELDGIGRGAMVFVEDAVLESLMTGGERFDPALQVQRSHSLECVRQVKVVIGDAPCQGSRGAE